MYLWAKKEPVKILLDTDIGGDCVDAGAMALLHRLCDLWPGELVFSSYEIGLWCVSMRGYIHKAPKADPVRRAYEVHPAKEMGRESWDHTAVLQAVRPNHGYWNLHTYGRIRVDDSDITTWHPEKTVSTPICFLLRIMTASVIRLILWSCRSDTQIRPSAEGRISFLLAMIHDIFTEVLLLPVRYW